MLKNKNKLVLAAAILVSASAAFAEYPEKPITVIVGYSAGGGTDVMARNVAPFVEKYLGEGASVVVKNKPGASGQIGITEVANAKPDGYTIGTYNLPGMMARTLDRKADYSADSFTFLANIVNDPNVIVTSKKTGIETLEALISTAKEAPGSITVGMSSLGGDDHLALTKFMDKTETEFMIVPFKGSAPARTAILGGHVAAGVLNVSEVAKFKGELNVLGIAQKDRSEFAPDVPTMMEQGVDLLNGSMRGFVAPKGMPADVEAKLMAAFEKASQDPELLEKMRATANPVSVALAEDFEKLNGELYDLAKQIWETTPWK